MKDFDPNKASTKNSGIFGLPHSDNEAKLVLIPISWDATTSYKNGTSNGPEALFKASKYVELFDMTLLDFFEFGIALDEQSHNISKWNKKARKRAIPIIEKGGVLLSNRDRTLVNEVDDLCSNMNSYVSERVTHQLDKNKIVGIVGGDHSVSLGAIKSLLKKFPNLGVLQIDAHCDLREAFEGFKYSHASIMFNVIEETDLKKLVQVGIRDYCPEECNRIENSSERIETFFEENIIDKKYSGKNWNAICKEIISTLPDEVYVSFDIDGLDPSLCPNTGTPVPGGLLYQEALYLIKEIVKSGKKIIGFDLVEVAPGKNGDLDANVGAHLLYKLSGWCLKSQEN
ncbi:MAG: agmatinase family protein [Kiritimatiellales bacterium]|nr:agmatinase family protein [Kiritimatiellales bacterium]